MLKAGARPDVSQRIRRGGPAGSLSETLGELFTRKDGIEAKLEQQGLRDSLYVNAVDLGGTVCVLSSSARERRCLATKTVAAWSMMAAHLSAGYRLRSCPHGTSVLDAEALVDGEAIVDPDGKVHHAVGVARARPNLERLRDAAVAAIRARGELRRHDAYEALRLWQALVAGRWSLVDRFDSDGRRFLVARPNHPSAPQHRRLSGRETQALTLAALGHSNKIIAYELGLSMSSVATLLRRGLAKCGLRSRAEMVELFARTLPWAGTH
jgi:DNA-binding CsgD family transcriptional regulator